MKKVLITGSNSYIGTSFIGWVKRYSEQYSVIEVSLRDDSWRNVDFSNYNVVFHVAGIAHVSSNPKMKEMYYKVNRDLAFEVATKAKSEGVKQFVFMSSIIVYGNSSRERKIINQDTLPNPDSFYGDSKLQAEELLKTLNSDDFNIAILRPPMIYGKGSRGNYSKLSKLAKSVYFFPDIDNIRSMLYIDNLCEFVRLIIENDEQGIFFPQNREYIQTSEMVRLIGEAHGNKIRLIKLFNPIINLLFGKVDVVNKVFGNLVYDKSISKYRFDYCIRSLKESIRLTEGVLEE